MNLKTTTCRRQSEVCDDMSRRARGLKQSLATWQVYFLTDNNQSRNALIYCFSVVADEVRQLARRSSDSAADIRRLVDETNDRVKSLGESLRSLNKDNA